MTERIAVDNVNETEVNSELAQVIEELVFVMSVI